MEATSSFESDAVRIILVFQGGLDLDPFQQHTIESFDHVLFLQSVETETPRRRPSLVAVVNFEHTFPPDKDVRETNNHPSRQLT